MYAVHRICGRLSRNFIGLLNNKKLITVTTQSGFNKMTNNTSRFLRYNVTYTISRCYCQEHSSKTNKQGGENFETEFDESIKNARDIHWKRMKISLVAMGTIFSFVGIYLIYFLGLPKKDENGNTIEDEFSTLPIPQQFFNRMLREIEYYNKMIKQPTTDKLLPDMATFVHPYYQPKYTLVLEMSDVLLHPDWTYKTGWRFKKRPGVDKFLELVTLPLFELVVFTCEQGMTSSPLLDALDRKGYIMHRLDRNATQIVDGSYVKNLDCLNRDLSKVIVVDWNKHSVKFHRNNALIIPRWNGQDEDTALIDLAVFLRTIAASSVEDVRDVLKYYSQFENPVEAFRESERRLLEQLEEDEEKERQRGPNFVSKWANDFLKRRVFT